MKIFFLLLVCFVISANQVDSLVIKKDNLFLDKVSNQCFRYKDVYLQFLKNGRVMLIKEKTPFNTNSIVEFELHSIFTSLKAIYYSKEKNKYLGLVIVDNLLYTTEPESTIEQINFRTLIYSGVKNPYNI